MKELLAEMERLRENRLNITNHLNKNTIEMRQVVISALKAGLHAPTIARALGVTKRTVYNWSK
jgi:DNA-binding NarL/FixJ family response regulator